MLQCDIDRKDFNIEGTVLHGHDLYFFNRGNGPAQKNGIIRVENWENSHAKIQYTPVQLPEVKGISLGFTDAVLVGKYIFFIASAEDTVSTYDDGDILGSAVGTIRLDTLKLTDLKMITPDYKIEGLALMSQKGNNYTFLLCEDADDGIPETKVFNLKLDIAHDNL